MTYDELVERVGWGEEFSFIYQKNKYWISQNGNGYYLTRTSDSYTQEFDNSADLFIKGKINEKTILEIWNCISDFL